jgi:hypothetical protein
VIKRLVIVLPPSTNTNATNKAPLDERRTGFRASSGIIPEPFNLQPSIQQTIRSNKTPRDLRAEATTPATLRR